MAEEDKPGRARGLKSLVHDAVDFVVDRVEDSNDLIAKHARTVLGVITPEATPIVDGVQLLSAVPLATVRAVNRLIERGTDPIADYLVTLGPWLERERPAIAMRSDITSTDAWLADAAIGALNGAVGDYLHRERNGLDLGFSIRHNDRYFSAPFAPTPLLGGASRRRVAVFIHGLATTEWCWCWDAAAYHGDAAANFGTLLERDLGFEPLYARYNTGRHVFENGRLLADALDGIAGQVDEIILIGHSMGGLVARSACHHASQTGQRWLDLVTRSVSIGVPHQGAPLEKLGHLVTTVLRGIEHPGAQVPAEILSRRSAGIRDLGQGTLTDDDWIGKEIPLLDHITYYFIAATMTQDSGHPLGALLGDVLVRVPSASGPATSRREFGIETVRFSGILHHQMQNHPDVYAWLVGALGAS